MSTRSAAIDPPAAPPAPATARRHAGLDALRACMTVLVVFHHSAISYGAIGGWYYQETAPGHTPGSEILTLFCAINQAYFMGLFFFLAGYFTTGSLDRKGAARFLADRLLRLGLPLLVYGTLIGPATIALAQTTHGRGFTSTLVHQWRQARFETGPMWFAEALLLFSAAAALVHAACARSRRDETRDASRGRLPSDAMLALAAAVTGAAALALRSRWPVGVDVWGLQLGYFASYVVLYVGGHHAARLRWIERVPQRQVRRWWRVTLFVLPMLPLVYLLGAAFPGLRKGPLAVLYAFWEPLVAWGAILFLVTRFEQRFDRLAGFWRPLSRRAYAIYVVHPPVLVAIVLAWRRVPAAPLLKFAVSGTLACLGCYLLAGLLLRSARLASIL
ncbi:acyltransferase family protein [Burkholderia gladioli]|uniref:acyltransferase family protein n=1 Tax=Burkholderia gladioli TaxID=28095 RepID=UPI0016406255|nr:acyltransferase family protein [Burkholderia gladioli]